MCTLQGNTHVLIVQVVPPGFTFQILDLYVTVYCNKFLDL
jgi:hypothetical protein